MKIVILFIIIFVQFSGYSQTNTEVYLVDISIIENKTRLTNLRNISNNLGYDNQPSFYDDNTILFSSTRNEQTDIAKYDISSGQVSWVADTPSGSEYSPLRIPNSDNISAIRLDTTGLQRLYNYGVNSSSLIRKDAKVGYHVWHTENILVNTVLVENGMNLVLSNLKDQTDLIVAKNVGRSLHKIPNSELVSFLTHKEGFTMLNSLNPSTGETTVLKRMPTGVRDICWLNDGHILFPSGKTIVSINPSTEEKPKTIHYFDEDHVNQISRMAASTDGKHLAFVSEESPAKIVQKQVDSYNAGDLDAFINCYSKDVVVRNFPAKTRYIGHEKMRDNYNGLSPENRTYEVEVVKRIIIGNKVIDHEKVMQNGKFQQMQVALYEVNNNKISSMSFIFDDTKALNPETIVQKQMIAYNARDIDAFLETYTDGIEVFNFPNKIRYTGKEKMRENYADFFDSTPDLNYIVKNRMVIANYVIDEEYITANGNNFSAVAIYEIENDKIAKVTFLR